MKRKIIAIILAAAMTASAFTACSFGSKDDDSSSKKKHSRNRDDDEEDDDDDDDDKPGKSVNPDELSYEEGYLPYYEVAATSNDSPRDQITKRDEDFGRERSITEKYNSLNGITFVGSDGSEYVFDYGELKWCKDDDHSDNFHQGGYEAYCGGDAGIYMISHGYATVDSYTDYYDRNAGDEFYAPANLIVIEFNIQTKTISGSTEDENVQIIFYGYTDGTYMELWGFVGDVSNGQYYYLNMK